MTIIILAASRVKLFTNVSAMTFDYSSILENIFKGITSDSTESDVEQKLIIPLLHILGYTSNDWQSQAVIFKSKLDFLVGQPSTALIKPAYLIIEVKAPNKKINHSVWQINNYMRQTGAILGLLTNGYDFHLLCNYNETITSILEFSQADFIKKNKVLCKILSKNAYLSFTSALYKNQQHIRLQFINAITQIVEKQGMSSLFNKAEISSEATQQISSVKQLEITTVTDAKKEGTSSLFNENEISSEPTQQISSVKQLEIENITDTKKEKKSMIITVFNNKGGVGKTTTTINLAAALSKLGKRVLLIDIDAQANLTMGLGIDPLEDIEQQGKKDISHLLTEPRTSIEDIVIHKKWDDVELDIIPSHIRLSDMEATLIMTPDIDRVLVRKLKKYKTQYDYVLIDPPPSFGKANTISLMASSGVLIPTHLSPYPIRALEYVIKRTIAVDQSRDESLPILGIAVSMYDRSAHRVAVNMAQKIFDIINDSPESKNVELFPQNTWVPRLNIVSNVADKDKGYPLCYAEFDSNLSTRDKESAQDAFNCYIELAKHLITITK